MRFDPTLFEGPTLEAARRLLGVTLTYGGSAGVIVETEAYAGDPASHFVTRPKTGAMLGTTHGLVYVYRIYGIHQCVNFTTDSQGPGAVLIRAIEPVAGLDAMRRRRGRMPDTNLTSGPAKLFAALGLDASLHGRPVTQCFGLRAPESPPDVVAGPRIGISKATDLPWRFHVRGNRYVSRPR